MADTTVKKPRPAPRSYADLSSLVIPPVKDPTQTRLAAVCLVGYKCNDLGFIVQNFLGPRGARGFGILPYDDCRERHRRLPHPSGCRVRPREPAPGSPRTARWLTAASRQPPAGRGWPAAPATRPIRRTTPPFDHPFQPQRPPALVHRCCLRTPFVSGNDGQLMVTDFTATG